MEEKTKLEVEVVKSNSKNFRSQIDLIRRSL